MHDVAIMCGVLATFTLLNLLPLWFPARRWLAPGPWPVTAAGALLLSVAGQSVCGLLWCRWVRLAPDWEGVGYLGLCAVLNGAAGLWPRRAQRPPPSLPPHEAGWLVAILLASLVLRSLHPLQHWALGQSDAYTHLTMIRQLLAWGLIGNENYPSGFAWIMSLPTTVCGWDPYFLARFAGAGFGTAMVLAVYALLRQGSGSGVTALLGAALVAACPALMLLIKTGVGAFANQLGFILLPLVWLGYLQVRTPETRGCGVLWLTLALLGMALAVPMLLMHVGGVLLLLVLLDGPWSPAALRRRAALILLLALVGTGLLAIPVAYMGARERVLTATLLTCADQTPSAASLEPNAMTPLFTLGLLARDFFSLKRCGFHAPLLDAALLGVVLTFLGVLVWGLRRRQPSALLLGCWGGLAGVQVATGCLQFTAYQREGWSLLIALGCLGGASLGWAWSRQAALRIPILCGLLLASGWSFGHPPAHAQLNSGAEEELIRAARLLVPYPALGRPPDAATAALRTFLADALRVDEPLTVLTRSLIQEGVLSAVAGFNPRLAFPKVTATHPLAERMATGNQFLILIDAPDDSAPYPLGLFGTVSPAVARRFVEEQNRRYATNRDMAEYVSRLPRDAWFIAEHGVTARLRAIVVRREPATPSPGGER